MPTSNPPPAVIFDRVPSGPFSRFQRWYRDAERAGISRAEAMALATSDANGLPSVRFVLLKRCDRRGFVFFTNARSRKGRQLRENPRAAAVFFWESLGRQVLVRGTVTQVSDRETDEYWSSRPRGSRIAALASAQSSPIRSRSELDARVKRLEAMLRGKDVPRPPQWSGFVIRPKEVEFWTERPNRLHERELFVRRGNRWKLTLLQP